MTNASPSIVRRTGFTIVELLIVIVVIGILAAITIVAYNGIQNRVHDASVSSDANAIVKKLEIQKVDSSSGTYSISNSTLGFTVSANRASYAVSPAVAFNLMICADNNTISSDYAVLVTSKSGKRFVSTKGSGVREFAGAAWGGDAQVICQTVSSSLYPGATGYVSTDSTTGPWRAWAGGN